MEYGKTNIFIGIELQREGNDRVALDQEGVNVATAVSTIISRLGLNNRHVTSYI